MSESNRDSRPENINREPVLIKTWAAIGKALLPTLISARTDIHNPRLQGIIRWAAATEVASAFLIPINPAIAALTYGGSRVVAMAAELTDQKRWRSSEGRKSRRKPVPESDHLKNEPFPVRLIAGVGKVILPTLLSSKNDIQDPRLQGIIRTTAATETLSLFLATINPGLAAATYGGSRIVAMLAESADQRKRR